MEIVVDFTIFASPNVGKYSYLHSFLNKRTRPKDTINRPEKWLLAFPYGDSEETLIVRVFVDRILDSTQGILVMYDVTNRSSYNESVDVIRQIIAEYPNMAIVWIANKVDSKFRVVSKVEALALKKKLGSGRLLRYRDVSVKRGKNVHQSLEALLEVACSLQMQVNEVVEGVSFMTLE